MALMVFIMTYVVRRFIFLLITAAINTDLNKQITQYDMGDSTMIEIVYLKQFKFGGEASPIFSHAIANFQ